MAGKNPHTKWGGIFPLQPGGGTCQYEIATPYYWHDPESVLATGLDRCRETATIATRKGVLLCEEHVAFVASSFEPLEITFAKAHPEFVGPRITKAMWKEVGVEYPKANRRQLPEPKPVEPSAPVRWDPQAEVWIQAIQLIARETTAETGCDITVEVA